MTDQPRTITSVEELFSVVRSDYSDWQTETFPWFRGEPLRTETPLLPVLFREPGRHDENRLLQQFRMKAPSLGLGTIPPRDHTDQWLFLARHVGLPTRLLDWTEGLLIGLLFAVYNSRGEPRNADDGATLWMLDPVELNNQSTPQSPSRANDFPLTWINHLSVPPTRGELLSWLAALADDGISDKAQHLRQIRDGIGRNAGALNVMRAWGSPKDDSLGTHLPIAVHGTSIHPRITAQKGCFTIHGIVEQPLSELVDRRVLKQYIIDANSLDRIRRDLRLAGITYSTMFPDLDGLAVDLRSLF
jgi:FRG domain